MIRRNTSKKIKRDNIVEEETMMMGAEEKELIRRAYYVERKSVRQIAKEEGRSRKTVKQVVESEGREVKREQGRRGQQSSSVYEPYRRRVEEL